MTWLDELSRTSQKFPGPEAARVEDLSVQFLPKGGAKISVKGVVDKSARVRQLEDSLRDKQHNVQARRNDRPHAQGPAVAIR